ncbi:MAG: multidrug ABC transporter ATP-binding protein [Acidobacteria bacterium]|nr:MAG: multidrug ABC transporter ATP-binding protein [Acidobacteriota bacterium]PYY09652.1 MAG: multidrug ABC transporter ATP-binding protein [Acidobacteriota bacterium]
MRQLSRLLRYVAPYWWQVLASVALMAAVGLLDAFRVLLVGPIFDRVLNPASQSRNIQLFKIPGTQHPIYLQQFVPPHFQNAWTIVAFALVAATILKGIFDYAGTYLVNFAGFGMITDLRDDLYNSILRRSAAFFQRHATGTLLSAIVNDIERIQFAMSSVLAEFLQQLFTFIFTAGVVVLLGGRLAWVLVLFVPFIIYSAGRIGRRVRSTTRRGQDKLADIQNILHETITGNRIVKAFSMESWEAVRFRNAARRLFHANLRSVAASALSSPLMDIFGAIAIAMLVLLGRNLIAHNAFTPGIFLAFIVAVFKLYDPVRKFTLFNNNFQQALGASSEVFRFMDVEDEVREKPRAQPLPRFYKNIRFDHVCFSYHDKGEGARDILNDINLEVKAGEVLAVVGSSGAGKSTLVHLIPRFFDVTAGRLLIDNQDIRDVTLTSLRSQVGIVTQETVLFNDTVRNNIAYGQPHVSAKDVEAAAGMALAHDFITVMPAGYDTVIGERGVRLSGGERQRIAIARAILKNAPILILDEATSALDTESEALVQSAVGNLMAGRTVVVIAHRLSTVRRADRIVVLEGGTISDVGAHDDLMKKLGTYRRLYDLQFVDLDQPRPVPVRQ